MFKQGNPGGGRPKKAELWKDMEQEVRRVLPYMLRLTKSQIKRIMSKDPTLVEIAALEYIRRQPGEVIGKFLPASWADDFEVTDITIPIELEHIEQATNGINNFNA